MSVVGMVLSNATIKCYTLEILAWKLKITNTPEINIAPEN